MARKLNHTSSRKRTAQPPDLPKTFAQLSSGRRKLFRPVLENPRGYVLLSARQLARRLGVDPATAVRVTMNWDFQITVSSSTTCTSFRSPKPPRSTHCKPAKPRGRAFRHVCARRSTETCIICRGFAMAWMPNELQRWQRKFAA